MLRTLRKYNKIILVIGGSLLMVIFLLPSTFTQMGPSAFSQKVGEFDGQELTLADVRQAGDELVVASRLASPLLDAIGVSARNPEHWMLLTREAEKAGLVGYVRDGRSLIPDMARMAYERYLRGMASQMSREMLMSMLQNRDQQIAQVAQSLESERAAMISGGTPEPQIDRALAKARGVMRLVESNDTSSISSSIEAIKAGHRILDTATFGVVTIPAATAIADFTDPGEERIAEHFEKYKNTDPQTDPHGIGYLRKPAAKVEFIKVDANVVSAALKIDPIEVNKYWRQNQARFPGEFEASRGQVENEYRRKRVEAHMNRVAEAMKRLLYSSTATLAVEGEYKVLPEDWGSKMPALQQLAAQAESELRRDLPDPGQPFTSISQDDIWRTDLELSLLPGIGAAEMSLTEQIRASFPQYVLAAKELDGPPRAKIQEGIIFGPLTDAGNSLYYARVVDTRKQSPPLTVDEVRAQVVTDIRLLDGMEKLRTEAEVYRQRAAADGLAKLGEAQNQPVRWGLEGTAARVRMVGGVDADAALNTEAFREALIQAAAKLDPKVDPTTLEADARTIAMVIPEARGLVVAQITRWRPMTIEQYRKSSALIAAELEREALRSGGLAAFSFERLADRHGYRLPEADKGTSEDPVGAADASPTSGG